MKTIDLGVIKLEELEEYKNKVINAGAEIGCKEVFESNSQFHVPGFWDWFDSVCILGLLGKTEPEKIAEQILDSMKKIVEDKTKPESSKDLYEYTIQVIGNLIKLGMPEFYNNNHFLHTPDFKDFLQKQVKTAFDFNIPPDRAAEVLMQEVKNELGPEKFMEQFKFGDIKH